MKTSASSLLSFKWSLIDTSNQGATRLAVEVVPENYFFMKIVASLIKLRHVQPVEVVS